MSGQFGTSVDALYLGYGCSKWHVWGVTGETGALLQIDLNAQEIPCVALSVN